MREFTQKVGTGRGRPFTMLELDDGTIVRKRDHLKAMKTKSVVAEQAKSPDNTVAPGDVSTVTVQ